MFQSKSAKGGQVHLDGPQRKRVKEIYRSIKLTSNQVNKLLMAALLIWSFVNLFTLIPFYPMKSISIEAVYQ